MAAVREGTKLGAVKAGNPLIAIMPTCFDEVVRMATLAVNAGLYKNEVEKDGEKLIAQATMAIMKGLELGIPPMQALEGIAIINGRSCIWGDLIPALLWSHGFKIKEFSEGEGEEMVAVCVIRRPDDPDPIERRFSVKQAMQAGLWKTQACKSPWWGYRERMLQMRARGWCARDGASDVLKGLHVAEEEQDFLRQQDAAHPLMPTREFVEVPSAPPVAAAPKQIEAQPASQETGDVLEDLQLALAGAKTAGEAYDAWDEHSERICLAGMQIRQKGETMLEARLEQLPKQIEAQEVPAAAYIKPNGAGAQFDMLAGVPSAR